MIDTDKIYKIEITDVGKDGEGIGKIGGFTVFVKNALPGDIANIKLYKVKKNYAYGNIIEIIKNSENRVISKCDFSDICGGCSFQGFDYNAQLFYKKKRVIDDLQRIAGIETVPFEVVFGMENPYNYRNKAVFPVGIINGYKTAGLYSQKSRDLIKIDKCLIQHEKANNVLQIFNEFLQNEEITVYNEKTHRGLIKYLMVRTGFISGEVMVCVVINGDTLPQSQLLINNLQEIDGLKSVVININKEKNAAILGNKCETLFGGGYIYDYLCGLKFRISPLSFFQVNPAQTEKLYDKVIEFAEIAPSDTIIDAYCGAGAISLNLAKKAKKVIGIEIMTEAVADAKINAEINNINNVEFYAGKSEKIIPEIIKQNKTDSKTIVLDPPRKGCDSSMLDFILSRKFEKIVYVSCDSATMARDIKIMNNRYILTKCCAFDAFPFTNHIETICQLYPTPVP